MKRQFITPVIVAAAVALGQAGCSSPGTPKRLAKAGSSKKEMTFPEDVAFLQKHVEVITLGQGEGQPQVAIVPAYQGRVMTSTVGGDEPKLDPSELPTPPSWPQGGEWQAVRQQRDKGRKSPGHKALGHKGKGVGGRGKAGGGNRLSGGKLGGEHGAAAPTSSRCPWRTARWPRTTACRTRATRRP